LDKSLINPVIRHNLLSIGLISGESSDGLPKALRREPKPLAGKQWVFRTEQVHPERGVYVGYPLFSKSNMEGFWSPKVLNIDLERLLSKLDKGRYI
jgi:hypothetical protein